jgi:hypothetical protein
MQIQCTCHTIKRVCHVDSTQPQNGGLCYLSWQAVGHSHSISMQGLLHNCTTSTEQLHPPAAPTQAPVQFCCQPRVLPFALAGSWSQPPALIDLGRLWSSCLQSTKQLPHPAHTPAIVQNLNMADTAICIGRQLGQPPH